MTLVAELPDVEVAGDEKLLSWRPRAIGRRRMAMASALPQLSHEDVDIDFKLAAVVDDRVVSTVGLAFRRRVRIDDVAHLYTDDGSALAAHLTLDPGRGALTVSLTFEAAGMDAHEARDVAVVLRDATAGALALVLPDGTLAPDRIPVPGDLSVDQPFLDFLQLLVDVGELAAVVLPVPTNPDAAFLRELLNARRLLRGESVRGRWKDGRVAFDSGDPDSAADALEVGGRHQFAVDAELAVTVDDVAIPLGLIRRQFDDAVVEAIERDGSQVVLLLRAHGGSADMVMTPIGASRPEQDVRSRIEVEPTVFEELVADLDAPARWSPLRNLL